MQTYIRDIFFVMAILLMAIVAHIGDADAKTTRIKDIVEIEGVRDNPLVG